MAKLSAEELEELYVEMIEHEAQMKEMEIYSEHEDAGDRV